jgi:small subunit ribosomal protein S7
MVLIFNKYDTKEVVFTDPSLSRYMVLDHMPVPHTHGKHQGKPFSKVRIGIVERLANKIMRSGQGRKKLSGKFMRGKWNCGSKLLALKIVEKAFDKIFKEQGKNPLILYVKAIENSAPREDTTRLKRGGIVYPVSVDVSSMRRVDESIKNIALAAFAQSFNSKMSAEDALAKEIVLASNNAAESYSIKRKAEVERIAKASR